MVLIAIAGRQTYLYDKFSAVAQIFSLYGLGKKKKSPNYFSSNPSELLFPKTATVPLTYLFAFTATDPWDARLNILFIAFMCGPLSASISFLLDLLGHYFLFFQIIYFDCNTF